MALIDVKAAADEFAKQIATEDLPALENALGGIQVKTAIGFVAGALQPVLEAFVDRLTANLEGLTVTITISRAGATKA